jgi:hypothetical protein
MMVKVEVEGRSGLVAPSASSCALLQRIDNTNAFFTRA